MIDLRRLLGRLRTGQQDLPVRTLLMLFALAITTPILVTGATILWRAGTVERELLNERSLQVVRTIANDVDSELGKMITMGRTLASSVSLSERGLQRFQNRAKQALVGSPYYIVLVDHRKGQQLANTRATHLGRTLPRVQRLDLFQRAAKTRKPVISDLQMSSADSIPVLGVVVPVVRSGRVTSVLAIAVPATHFLEILRRAPLPEGWQSGIAGTDNRIIARLRDHAAYVGKVLPQGSARPVSDTGSTLVSIEAIAGYEVMRAFTRSRISNWMVAAWVPSDSVRWPRWKSWMMFLAGAIAVIGLSLLLALAFGRQIAGPIEMVADSARNFGKGQLPIRVNSALKEANEVARALRLASIERNRSERSNAQLAAIVASSADAMLSVDHTGAIQSWNAAAGRLTGFGPDEAQRRTLVSLFAPVSQDDIEAALEDVRNGETRMLEGCVKTASDDEIDVEVTLAPLRSPTGDIAGASLIIDDIRERKRHERHLFYVMRELSHRSKNLLAVVQAVARRTAAQASDLDDYQKRFNGRIQGLARSHEVLIRHDWRGVEMQGLAKAQLGWLGNDLQRVEFTGPDLLLAPEAAQNLGMVFHELATNALKYGALSVAEGRVAISWKLAPTKPPQGNGEAPAEAPPEHARDIVIQWREKGGPEVRRPQKTGFGRIVVTQMIEAALSAQVNLRHHKAGLTWSARIPDRYLVEGDEPVAPTQPYQTSLGG
ncbi:MAG: HWE histidine kinase domain-containing protein [Pseudomonadota bacterium]